MDSNERSVERWHEFRHRLLSERASIAELAEVYDLIDDEIARSNLQRIVSDRTPGWGRQAYRAWVLADPSLGLLAARFRRSHQDAETPSEQALVTAPIGTRGGAYAWRWSYPARASIHAHRRYQDPSLLGGTVAAFRRLLAYRDDRLGLVDDFRGRIIKSWGSRHVKPPRSWRVIARGVIHRSAHADRARPYRVAGRGTDITSAGMIVLPMCELLRYADSIGFVVPDAEELVERMLETVGEFEDDYRYGPFEGAGYYINPASHDVEPLNHASMFAAALVHLHALSGDDGLLERARQMDRFFRASWQQHDNDTISWPYVPRPGRMSEGSAEAVYKAAVTIELPLALGSAGDGYTGAEMTSIARIFTRNVWPDDARVNMSISPRSYGPLHDIRPEWIDRLALITNWIRLDSYEPNLRPRILEAVATRPEWFPQAWLSGAILARCFALAEPRHEAVRDG